MSPSSYETSLENRCTCRNTPLIHQQAHTNHIHTITSMLTFKRTNEHVDMQNFYQTGVLSALRTARVQDMQDDYSAVQETESVRTRGCASVRARVCGRGTNATRNFAHELADGVDGVRVFVIVIYEVPDFAQAFVHQEHARVEIFHKSLAADHCHIRNQDRFKTSAAPPGNKEANFAHNQDVVFREVVR